MTPTEVQRLLAAGMAAARAGQREEALSLLLQVIEVDERSEDAWLWLSGVVDDDADRRVCLENVLALNPEHEMARRGLARLAQEEGEPETAVSPQPEPDAAAPSPAAEGEEIVVRREYAPHSLASAVLYPESQVKEWRYRDTVPVRQAPAVETAAKSSYDDVWARNVDICAYCARELSEEDQECPRCRRPVWRREFRYAEPSMNMHILWVMLAGIGQLFLVHGLYNMIVERVLFGAILAGIFMLVFFALAVGVYFRQSWAHLGAIVGSSLILLAILIDALIPLDLSALEMSLQDVDPAIAGFLGPFAGMIGETIQILELGAAIGTLATAVFASASDFQKWDVQQTARLKKGVGFASDHHATAKEFARRGMMATAVLHWQRAVGHQPNHPVYLRHLGRAYATLGFYERSLDVLHSGLNMAVDPEQKATFQKLITMVRQHQEKVTTNE